MSIYSLKPKFQNLLRPLNQYLFESGVTANQVTLFACMISVLLGLGLYALQSASPLFILMPIWMLVRMALNAIDGMLARDFKQKSRLGAYLNEVTDVVSDAVLYLPFIWISPFSTIQITLVIWLSAISEMVGILGQVIGKTRRYDGPMGKSDRAFVFGLLGLLVGTTNILTQHRTIFYGLMWFVIILIIGTIIRRIHAGLQEV